MESIKISLNLNKITAVNQELQQIEYEPSTSRTERVERSILDQVAKRMMKKQINIYPSNKPFNFKLEYYEANTLELILRTFLKGMSGNEENYHPLRMVADDINQKLA